MSIADTVTNAARLMRAGAGAVKLEGGRKRLDAVQAILDAEIPVMGHLGLTPQSVHALGGFRVQGKDLEAAASDRRRRRRARRGRLLRDRARVRARRAWPGSSPTPSPSRRSASVPAVTATARCSCSTTCSGSRSASRRSSCAATPNLGDDARAAIAQFADDVRAGRFPSSDETYHAADTVADEIAVYGGARA